jgi:hypothetical protein
MVFAAIGAVATGVSVGMSIFGANEQRKAQKEQARIAGEQAKLAKQQIGIQQEQLGVTRQGATEEYQAFLQQSQFDRQGEDIRMQAMIYDAGRRQLEALRLYQRARAAGLAQVTGQGASGGSALQGVYGQISGQTAWNTAAVTKELNFGQSLFNLNREASLAKDALAGRLYALQQQNFDLTNKGFELAKVGADLQAQYVAAGGKAAEGAGIAALGQSIGAIGGSLGRVASGIRGLFQEPPKGMSHTGYGPGSGYGN